MKQMFVSTLIVVFGLTSHSCRNLPDSPLPSHEDSPSLEQELDKIADIFSLLDKSSLTDDDITKHLHVLPHNISVKDRQRRRTKWEEGKKKHLVEISPLRHQKKNKDGKTPLAIILAASDVSNQKYKKNNHVKEYKEEVDMKSVESLLDKSEKNETDNKKTDIIKNVSSSKDSKNDSEYDYNISDKSVEVEYDLKNSLNYINKNSKEIDSVEENVSEKRKYYKVESVYESQDEDTEEDLNVPKNHIERKLVNNTDSVLEESSDESTKNKSEEEEIVKKREEIKEIISKDVPLEKDIFQNVIVRETDISDTSPNYITNPLHREAHFQEKVIIEHLQKSQTSEAEEVTKKTESKQLQSNGEKIKNLAKDQKRSIEGKENGNLQETLTSENLKNQSANRWHKVKYLPVKIDAKENRGSKTENDVSLEKDNPYHDLLKAYNLSFVFNR